MSKIKLKSRVQQLKNWLFIWPKNSMFMSGYTYNTWKKCWSSPLKDLVLQRQQQQLNSQLWNYTQSYGALLTSRVQAEGVKETVALTQQLDLGYRRGVTNRGSTLRDARLVPNAAWLVFKCSPHQLKGPPESLGSSPSWTHRRKTRSHKTYYLFTRLKDQRDTNAERYTTV